jgi:hypothetical protein
MVLRICRGIAPGSNIQAWLTTVARHKALDQIRAQNRRAVPHDPLPEPTTESQRPFSPELLSALVGLPYDHVASVLGGTAASARRAAADGLKSVRRLYGER